MTIKYSADCGNREVSSSYVIPEVNEGVEIIIKDNKKKHLVKHSHRHSAEEIGHGVTPSGEHYTDYKCKRCGVIWRFPPGTIGEEICPYGEDAQDLGADITFKIGKIELGFQNSEMRRPKVVDPLDPPKDVRIGVIKEDSITFKAMLPSDVTLADSQYNWSGEKTGTGPEISVTFNNIGNRSESLTILGATMTATTTVIYVPPPNKYWWAILNPWTWPTVQSLGEETGEWARINEASLGGGLHNGRADAARHAYWNVLMTVEINATDAEGASTAYERSNLSGGHPHNEIVIDMENNADGRVIAGGLPPEPSRTVCQNAVISALDAGTFTILDVLTNSKEAGLLQPSNKPFIE